MANHLACDGTSAAPSPPSNPLAADKQPPDDDSDGSGTESESTSAATTTTTTKKKRGRDSPLTLEQQQAVRARFRDWEKLLRKKKLHLGKLDSARGRDPESITTWLDDTVKEIRTSPIFANTIKDMFRNYRHNTFVKRNQHDIVQKAIANLDPNKTIESMDALKAAETLVSFKHSTTAKDIFRMQNQQKINEEALRMQASAAQAREEAGIDPDDVDKRRSDNELWKNADQDSYAKMAHEPDIFENQKRFPAAMKTSLEAICQSGALGSMEIFMLFGFRNEKNKVQFGRLNAHHTSAENGRPPPHFLLSQENDTRAETLKDWWSGYCELHVPKRPELQETQPNNVPTYIEYKNSIPVLVGIDLRGSSASDVCKVLKEFLQKLWEFSWPKDQDHPSIPLINIHTNPDDYYDTVTYNFPVSLTEIETLQIPDLFQLAAHLLRICAPSCAEPFTFRKKAEIQKRRDLRLQQEAIDSMAGQEIIESGVPAPLSSQLACGASPESLPGVPENRTPDSNIPFVPSSAVSIAPPLENHAPGSNIPSMPSSAVSIAPPLIPNVSHSHTPALPSASSQPSPLDSDIPFLTAKTSSIPLQAVKNVVPPVSNVSSFSSQTGLNGSPPTSNVSLPPSVDRAVVPISTVSTSSITPSNNSTLPPNNTPPSSSISQITGSVSSLAIPVRTARKTRGSGRKNHKKHSGGDVGPVTGPSTSSNDEVNPVSEVRRSSRARITKRPNADSSSQPAAKKPKRSKGNWCDVVTQSDGRVAMIDSNGVFEGYVTQNAEGNAVLITLSALSLIPNLS
ncbi:hypothetical protein FB446DRAFT_788935 [Lentinula raphanica]|nr:hypothetical protein FB446DRAFT_788935 [Lentinula raphanica]